MINVVEVVKLFSVVRGSGLGGWSWWFERSEWSIKGKENIEGKGGKYSACQAEVEQGRKSGEIFGLLLEKENIMTWSTCMIG